MRLTYIITTCVFLSAYRSTQADLYWKLTPIISRSASGWTIKPGAEEKDTTVVVNPDGQKFDIGKTPYPDIHPATLWIMEIKELQSRFLLIHIPPACSASVPMPILYLDRHNRPSIAAVIKQRCEFSANPEDTNGHDPKIKWDGEHSLRSIFFEDLDGDGIPKLVESEFGPENNSVTYYYFTTLHKFVPFRKEQWKYGDNGYVLIARKNIYNFGQRRVTLFPSARCK